MQSNIAKVNTPKEDERKFSKELLFSNFFHLFTFIFGLRPVLNLTIILKYSAVGYRNQVGKLRELGV